MRSDDDNGGDTMRLYAWLTKQGTALPDGLCETHLATAVGRNTVRPLVMAAPDWDGDIAASLVHNPEVSCVICGATDEER